MIDRQSKIWVELRTENQEANFAVVRVLESGRRQILRMSEDEAEQVHSELGRNIQAAGALKGKANGE